MQDRNDIPASFTAAIAAEVVVLIVTFLAAAITINGSGILGIFQ